MVRTIDRRACRVSSPHARRSLISPLARACARPPRRRSDDPSPKAAVNVPFFVITIRSTRPVKAQCPTQCAVEALRCAHLKQQSALPRPGLDVGRKVHMLVSMRSENASFIESQDGIALAQAIVDTVRDPLWC